MLYLGKRTDLTASRHRKAACKHLQAAYVIPFESMALVWLVAHAVVAFMQGICGKMATGISVGIQASLLIRRISKYCVQAITHQNAACKDLQAACLNPIQTDSIIQNRWAHRHRYHLKCLR